MTAIVLTVGMVHDACSYDTAEPVSVPPSSRSGVDSVRSAPLAQVFFGFRDRLAEGNSPVVGFGFTRSHFGYRHVFSTDWKGVVILDMGLPTTAAAVDASLLHEGSAHTVTLKFAYVDWTPNDAFSLQFGSILQNHFITQERFWGLRFVEKTFQDQYFGIPSADLGAIAYVRLKDNLRADVALTNGEGFRHRQDTRSRMKIAGGVTHTRGAVLQTRMYASAEGAVSDENITMALSFFAGWRPVDRFQVGVDLNYLRDGNRRTGVSGGSVFTNLRMNENFDVFSRWDMITSDHSGAKAIEPTALEMDGNAGMIGCAWRLQPDIRLAVHGRIWVPDVETDPVQGSVGLSSEYLWN